MLRILDAHSQCAAIPFETELYHNPANYAKRHELLYFWLAELKNIYNYRQNQFLIEKTPKHILHINNILKDFPKAKFILMLRDGREAVASMKKRKEFNYDTALQRWINDNQAAISHLDAHYLYLVKLEALKENPVNTMKGVLSFLGLSFEEEILNYHKNPKHFFGSKTFSKSEYDNTHHNDFRNWQVNQPILENKTTWMQELTQEEKIAFFEKAQDLLIKFNYEHDAKWLKNSL
ncbi:MAG: sulfotransferase [Microscillaceae bacterium]|nr:sulfotransferase [Microscillaceae bacterium]